MTTSATEESASDPQDDSPASLYMPAYEPTEEAGDGFFPLGLAAFFGQTHVSFRGIRDGDGEFQADDRYTKAPKVVEPKVPFHPEFLPENGSRRERLATWVTHPKNPYFARAAVNRVHVHDLHATVLALLGFDHKKLTYRYNGRDFRLTDNYGKVVKALIA